VDRFYAESLLPEIDSRRERVDPRAVAAVQRKFETARTTPSNMLTQMIVPAITPAVRKAASSHTAMQQAAIACALERCRLARGQLPDTLNALAPEFLERVPHDVIDGQPLRYRRISADPFVIYSIG
jgi:hypothetical protein